MEHRPSLLMRLKSAWRAFRKGPWDETGSARLTPAEPTEDTDAGAVKQNGWRQGSVLGAELVEHLAEMKVLPRMLEPGNWVVISHDCDVTNGSFEKEPFVELMFAKCVEQQDGNKRWGKNSRLLQIVESNRIYEFNAHDRRTLPRRYLVGHKPDLTELSNESREQLIGWVGRRYTRRAFADEFNRRSGPAVRTLRRRLKQDGALISGIYILVSDEELSADVDYEVVVWASMKKDDYAIEEKRTSAMDLLGEIETALNDCNGIVVEGTDLRPESEISIADIRIMKRWDYDDLTVRDEGAEALPRDN